MSSSNFIKDNTLVTAGGFCLAIQAWQNSTSKLDSKYLNKKLLISTNLLARCFNGTFDTSNSLPILSRNATPKKTLTPNGNAGRLTSFTMNGVKDTKVTEATAATWNIKMDRVALIRKPHKKITVNKKITARRPWWSLFFNNVITLKFASFLKTDWT